MDSRGLRVPLIGNVYVQSLGAARTMHAGLVPGCVVTEDWLSTIEAEFEDSDKGKGKRMERAAKMVAMFKGMGFHGVHIGGFALKTPARGAPRRCSVSAWPCTAPCSRGKRSAAG